MSNKNLKPQPAKTSSLQAFFSLVQLPFSIIKIAWRSIQHRLVPAILTMLSMGLGVMLIVAVLTMFGVVSDSFRNNSSLGYDLVIGAKGGKMQLTLNSVYYLSQPIETIPYEYYLEFYDGEYRAEELQHSFVYRAHEARWNATDLDLLQSSSIGMTGPAALMQSAILSELKAEDRASIRMDADGRFENYADLAIPINLGDYFNEYRVVATQRAFFEELVVDYETKWNSEEGDFEDVEKHFATSEGRFFEHENLEHGFFECVVGSAVAKKYNVKIGDYINPTHGAQDGHKHENGFTVVGILESTGTPNDRVVFVNIEGFFLMEDHAKPLAEAVEENDDEETALEGDVDTNDVDKSDDQAESADEPNDNEDSIYQANLEPLPVEQREVTAILVRGADMLSALNMETPINEGALKSSLRYSPYVNGKQDAAQAVSPIEEIESLLGMFVYPIQSALLVLTGMICIVSGISILVSIYNSMAERRHEIAVMRSLGASRWMVLMIIMSESVILSLFGGLGGWFAGHLMNLLASPMVEAKTGVKLGLFDFAPPLFDLPGEWLDSISSEWLLIPGAIMLAVLVGLYPAITAYRTDVSKSL